MIQLTFQPAFDVFHAVFRLLRLRPIISAAGSLPRDHVRILDFYLLFPYRIDDIRLMPKHKALKKLASDFEELKPYGEQPHDRTLFNRMTLFQISALNTLAKRGLIKPDQWQVANVQYTDVKIPPKLIDRARAKNEREAELLALLRVLATEYELLGSNGLKARTDLLEYRYDAI